MSQHPHDVSSGASPAYSGDPDAHGQAALLLVESLIHGLISRSVLSDVEAVEIIEVAAGIKVEIAEEGRETASTAALSLALLDRMAESLRRDAYHR